jgi:ribosome-associated toxin RatA of RatAB toxin-antitoxin module
MPHGNKFSQLHDKPPLFRPLQNWCIKEDRNKDGPFHPDCPLDDMAVSAGMKKILLMIAIACILPIYPAAQARDNDDDTIEVTVNRASRDDHTVFDVHAEGFVRATPQQAWKVLTDYDRLHEFVPGLIASRLVSRNGQEVILDQTGTGGFFFIKRNIHLIMRVTEAPFSSLDVAMVSGDMKHYTAHWDIVASTQDGISGTLITYTGNLEPDFSVPWLFSNGFVQSDVRKMVAGMLTEIGKSVNQPSPKRD